MWTLISMIQYAAAAFTFSSGSMVCGTICLACGLFFTVLDVAESKMSCKASK